MRTTSPCCTFGDRRWLTDSNRPLIDAARRQLHEYGVEPTDIASRNTVWDGERITVIDFVQPVDDEE